MTRRKIRKQALTDKERAFLRDKAAYQGHPHHKRSPGDFGLVPPSSPRPEKTLCDEAGVFRKAKASELLTVAIDGGLVSENTAADGFPKHLWAIDANGQVFEAMYGGKEKGRYHGYPIRRVDPLFDQVTKEWKKRHG